MKYISLIDELGISVHSIQAINTTRIEQLQKQLEFEAVLDTDIKITELSHLISQLENPDFIEATIFVERHLWLKKILLGRPEDLDNTSFDSTYDPRAITPYSKAYTTPFLLNTLTHTLSYLLKERKLQLFTRIVSQKRFFSDEVNQTIIAFLATQINNAKNILSERKLKESQESISFLHHSDFIASLNIHIASLTDEITEINSTVIRMYNLNQNTRNHEWDFAIAVMIAFGKLSLPNKEQQEVFAKNASKAKSSKFNPDIARFDTSNSQNNNAKATYIIIAFVGVIFIAIIATIPFINRSGTIDYYYENDTEVTIEDVFKESQQNAGNDYTNADEDASSEGDDEKKPIISKTPIYEVQTIEAKPQRTINPEYITLPKQSKGYSQDSHIRFLYSLKNKVSKGDDMDALEIIRVTPYTNPYPKTFNTIQTNLSNNTDQLEVTNSTQKELIIFKLQNGVDEAIIIPKEDKTVLNFKQGDSIAFYAGNDFTSSKFSHFTRAQDISNIYEIKSLSTAAKIEVLPFKDNSGSAKSTKFHRSVESLKLQNLEAKKLKPIESLYTDFYNSLYGK